MLGSNSEAIRMNAASRIYRHKKRGSEYIILAEAPLQINGHLDGITMIICQCVTDGQIWVRPKDEFFDGRFEKVTPRNIGQQGWPAQ